MRLRNQAGGVSIETALVLPVLMVILMGIIEYGIMFYDQAVIKNASRAGARYGIVYATPSFATTASIVTYTKNYIGTQLITFNTGTSTLNVTAVSSTTPPQFGSTLTVTVTYTYSSLILYRLISSSQTINLKAVSIMTYE